ncbi:MAG TPA: vWA domain-containing protein [Acidobacteriota bacterium]|nr:vWA domain-containing protein [Acidobacteriota bacterium]
MARKCRFAGWLVAALALSLALSCGTKAPEKPGLTAEANMECDLAAMFLFDVGETMGQDIGGGLSLLQWMAGAAGDVVQTVPSGRWNMGLHTFEQNAGTAAWGMEVVTDENRQSFVDALEALTAAGSSDMVTAFDMAGNLLTEDTHRPKFLVIVTDGGFCSQADGTCNQLLNIAAGLKADGVRIMAAGYNLTAEEQGTLTSITAPDPCTNSTSANEAYSMLVETVGTLCGFLKVELAADVPTGFGPGGTGTGMYSANYVQGEAVDVMLQAVGPFVDDGGTVRFEQATGTLGPGSPSFGGKFELTAGQAMSGSYALILKAVPDGGGPVLAALIATVYVGAFSLDVAYETQPAWDQAGGTVTGRVTITTVADAPVPVTISYLVTQAGGQAYVSGFDPGGNPMATTAPQGSSTIPVSFTIRRTDAPAGSYEIHIVVIGAGIRKEVASGPLTIQ